MHMRSARHKIHVMGARRVCTLTRIYLLQPCIAELNHNGAKTQYWSGVSIREITVSVPIQLRGGLPRPYDIMETEVRTVPSQRGFHEARRSYSG